MGNCPTKCLNFFKSENSQNPQDPSYNLMIEKKEKKSEDNDLT